MRAAIDPSMLATDLADYLVGKGLPFRQAHTLAGQAVQLAGKLKKSLDALSIEEFQSLDPSFDSTVYQVFDPQRSAARRNAIGGTAPEAVRLQLQNANKYLKPYKQNPTKGEQS